MPLNVNNILGSSPDLQIPAGINATTPEQKDMYRASLEFERVFVQQMVKQMNAATKAMAEPDEEGTSSLGAYETMVEDQMSQSMLDGGGIGLAGVLYNQLSGQQFLGTDAGEKPAGSAS